MRNAFAIVTLSGLLSACAVTPPARIEPMPEVVAQAPDEDAEPDDPSLPKMQLTKDLLYRLLKAEFEAREGKWQSAYATFVEVARQTGDPRLAKRAAELAIQERQSAQSLAAVRLWRELAPASEDAAQYLLSLLLLVDDLAEAETVLAQRLAQAGPRARPMAMHQAQQYLARARDKAAGSALFERLLAPYAETLEARVLLSQNAFARGDTEAALRLGRAALAQQPDSELAVLTLAQATPAAADQTALLAKFLEANPQAREVRAAQARLLVMQKNYADARREFERLLQDQPAHPATLYAAGLLAMQMHDKGAAEQYFVRFIGAIETEPSDGREPGKVLLALAQLAEDRGDLPASARWLEKIARDDDTHFLPGQIRRAQLIAKRGDVDGARAFLAALRTDEPAEQVQIVMAQAQLLREAGRLEAAYGVLEAGTQRYPSNPDLLYDFALLAEKNGKYEVMETALRKVMQLAPDNHHAYNALGYSLAERNVRLQEALVLIDRALAMAPGDPFILDSLGWVHYRLGNLEQAEAHLRRAYAQRNDVDIAAHLGEVLWTMGRKADAQALWREARARDPKNDTLRSTLARLHQNL